MPHRILGLVPARGGSKGIPRKNVRVLGGKPLLVHSIEAGLAAPSIVSVLCSTEDLEIAETARAAGARVPFLRPAELARDDSPTADAVIHALDELEKAGEHYDAVVLLQPTAPLRLPEDIEAAVRLFVEDKADSVISLTPAMEHPFTVYKLQGATPEPFIACPPGMRRQDFPPAFVRNGAIYLVACDVLRQRRAFYGDRLRAIVMPAERSVNLDEPIDWQVAEAMFAERAGRTAKA